MSVIEREDSELLLQRNAVQWLNQLTCARVSIVACLLYLHAHFEYFLDGVSETNEVIID